MQRQRPLTRRILERLSGRTDRTFGPHPSPRAASGPWRGLESLEARLMLSGVTDTAPLGDTIFTLNSATAEIHGVKWHDLNENAALDANEPLLPGWTIYLDENRNGQLDDGEPSTVTDAGGAYQFTGLTPGSYAIGEVIPQDWQQTYPGTSNQSIGGNGNSVTVPTVTTTGSDAPVAALGETIDAQTELTISTVQSTPLINLDDFRNDPRFAGIDGSGQAVVILDTGIDLNHPFFGPDLDNNGVADRIVYSYDFNGNDSNASDGNGHGSNVASIVGSSDSTYTGMAPGVDIIALQVLSSTGSGNFGDVEDALQWVVNNAATYHIASVNMSLGDGQNFTSPVQLYGISDELAALSAMGVTVVSAAGNDYYAYNPTQGVAYPAADPNSLAIGAVYDGNTGGWSYGSGAIAYSTTADQIAPFSQRSVSMSTLFAPGAPITGANYQGGTVTMHGTSQASPHVAGIVALAQQLAEEKLGRRLSTQEIDTLLLDSATTIYDGDNENDNVTHTNQNYPRVDVLALGEAILDMVIPPLSHVVELADGQVLSGVNFGNFLTTSASVLPYQENFGDGLAQDFTVHSGQWLVDAGRYRVSDAQGSLAVSTLDLGGPLPSTFYAQATVNVSPGGSVDNKENAFLVFDYQSPTDFKFVAGLLAFQEWSIGYADAGGFHFMTLDAVGSILNNTDYDLQVGVNGQTAELYIGGQLINSHTFGDNLSDGSLALATYKSRSGFDDLVVQDQPIVPPPPTGVTLPYAEDFSDGQAQDFLPVAGSWSVSGQNYLVDPLGDTAITTLPLAANLPTDWTYSATFMAEEPAGINRSANALLVFDYHSPTDYKFAGARVKTNEWTFGYVDQAGFHWEQLIVDGAINMTATYGVDLLVQGNQVTMQIDGQTVGTHTYADSPADGDLGLATVRSVTHFDNINVVEGVDLTPPAPITVPYSEDFNDNLAQDFQPMTGTWSAATGAYRVDPAGLEALTLLPLANPNEDPIDMFVTFSTQVPDTLNKSSNAFVIFDYQSPTDYKVAGAMVKANKIAIGRYTSSGLAWDELLDVATMNDNWTYDMAVSLSGGQVTLNITNGPTGDLPTISYTYGSSVLDGPVGLMTSKSVTTYDDFSIAAAQANSPTVTAFDFGRFAPNYAAAAESTAPPTLTSDNHLAALLDQPGGLQAWLEATLETNIEIV